MLQTNATPLQPARRAFLVVDDREGGLVAALKERRPLTVIGGARHTVSEQAEIVGQLHRSLALLRGCDGAGTRAQITSLVAALRARLHQLAGSDGVAGRQSHAAALIPDPSSALQVRPLECRCYAIQCESLASMSDDPGQRAMLNALARLWRGLAAR